MRGYGPLPTYARRDRDEAREDEVRLARNREHCPKAVAVERLIIVAIDHERQLPVEERMPLPALTQLEVMGASASHCLRIGQELSEAAKKDVEKFVRDHSKDYESLVAKVAAAVGQ